MVHSFDVEHAEKYGVGEAIIIQNMIFWIEKNRANGKHFHDGRTWTYNSVRAFQELFPYYTQKQIRTIIDRLIFFKILMKGNYSDNQSDRSAWFAFVDESSFLRQITCPESQNHLPEEASHLPHKANHYKEQILNTDNKPDIKNKNNNAANQKQADPFCLASARRLFELYRDRIDEKYKVTESQIISWAEDIDKIIRIDGRSKEEVSAVIEYVRTPGNFWVTNILSGKSLRKQFTRLVVEIKGSRQNKQPELRMSNNKTRLDI